MKLFGQHIHKDNKPWDGAPPWAVELGLMGLVIITFLEREMAQNVLDFSKSIAATTRQTTVTNSVLQALGDLRTQVQTVSAQLAAAIAASDPAAIQAAQTQLDALAAGIDENDDKIAAAIVAPGTPGTPPPPNA